MTLTQFPGDPAGLTRYGTKYERLSETILDIADTLNSLGSSAAGGDAIEQLHQNSRDVSGDIKKVQRRYHETALAIVEFAVALEDAQTTAATAISNHSDGSQNVSSLEYRHRLLEEDRLTALTANADQTTIDEINTNIRRLDHELGQAEYAVSNAQSIYDKAAQDREEAIAKAVARIQPVLDDLNDRLRDRVKQVVDAIADFIEAIAKWIAEVLTAVITAILLVVAAVIAAILVTLLVLILIGLLLVVLPLLLILVIHLVIAAIVTILAAIVFLVVRSVVRETLARTPEMTHREDTQQGKYERSPADPNDPNSHDEGDYENIFRNNGTIDNLGGTESTEIEIVTVYDDNGNIVGYRVVLPSTQDWEEANGLIEGAPDPKGDQGALNDLGSNVALLTMPLGLRGPYERAVIDALEAQMRLDGTYGQGTPVMMTGFSQGGILAGRMAADPNSPFNITAVVTAGSCIDTFPIPPSVSVLSLQHPDDPVPKLDGNFEGDYNVGNAKTDPSSNQVTVTVDKHQGEAAHGATSYALSAYDALDNSSNDQVNRIVDQQSVFFSGNEQVNIYSGHE